LVRGVTDLGARRTLLVNIERTSASAPLESAEALPVSAVAAAPAFRRGRPVA
jgi:hypothetical protein